MQMIELELLELTEENSIIGVFIWSYSDAEQQINRPINGLDVFQIYADTITEDYPDYKIQDN